MGIFSVDSEGPLVESQASLRNLRLYFLSTGGYELELYHKVGYGKSMAIHRSTSPLCSDIHELTDHFVDAVYSSCPKWWSRISQWGGSKTEGTNEKDRRTFTPHLTWLGNGPCGRGARLHMTTVGLYLGWAQWEERSLTVCFSLAPPGPSVRSPETEVKSN